MRHVEGCRISGRFLFHLGLLLERSQMRSNNLTTWMLAKLLCALPPVFIDFQGLATRFFEEKLISFAIAV
ncbi:hypothetical protein [uncultured Nostoc sp.]|uniref:hypothetical protein n=1 Tax=uncultured Nostoc sp. TaxID=340711 RepID=UPI0035CA580F